MNYGITKVFHENELLKCFMKINKFSIRIRDSCFEEKEKCSEKQRFASPTTKIGRYSQRLRIQSKSKLRR